MEKIVCLDKREIPEAARRIIEFCKGEKIWVFQGRMGAGKTTFIKEIARQMGVTDLVSSPTFSIVNEYRDVQGQPIYHFDFYRVDDPEEALDIGSEEYFYSGNYCWVEWAEKIFPYIPEKFALIEIKAGLNDERGISLKIIDDGSQNS